jgi:phenylacetate-coenzyme A ligase PaaK-like adenylate-forming protein
MGRSIDNAIMNQSLAAAIERASTAPFYESKALARVFRTGGLAAIEITRPADLRENAEEFLPRGTSPDRLIGPFTTSGTTGKAKRIYLSENDTREIAASYFDGLLRGKPAINDGELYVVSMLDRQGSLGRYITDSIVPASGYQAEICSALEPEKLADRVMTLERPFVLRSGLPIASRLLEILRSREFDPRNSKLQLMKLGGGPLSREASKRLMDGFGVDVLGVYGMTEIGGDLVAVETEPGSAVYKFTQRPYLIQELVPNSAYPDLHEVILTVLNREGTQLIRYGTQDLVRLKDDQTTFEIMGRFDDEAIFGQMNILWNSRVESEIEKHLGTSEFSIVLAQNDEGIDTFTIRMELSSSDDRHLVRQFVDALGAIDIMAKKHFHLGYYQVKVSREEPRPRILGHKSYRFTDLRAKR